MLNGDPVSDKYPDAPGSPVVRYVKMPVNRGQRRADDAVVELRHEDADSEQQQRPEMRGLRFAQAGSPFPQYDEKARSRLRDPNVTQALLSNIMLFYIKGYS